MSNSEGLEYQEMSCACGACMGGADHETAWTALAQSGGTSTGGQAQGGYGFSTSLPLSSISSDGYDLGDYLIHGTKWTMTELTYSFTNSTGDYGYNDHAGRFGSLNTTQRDAATDALDMVASFANLTFSELTGSSDRDAILRMAEGAEGPTAWAYLPTDHEVGGDMWFHPDKYNNPASGNYEYMTFMHELGHALGLDHGHTNGFTSKLPSAYDSHEYTVMTYRSAPGGPAALYNDYNGFSQSFMIADIKALQTLYGANFAYQGDDTVYTFSTTTGELFINGAGQGAPAINTIFRTIWDGDGVDTYDLSNFTTAMQIDLTPGGHSDFSADSNAQNARIGSNYYASGHVYNALQHDGDARSLIENAIGGSGNDEIIGNAADNVLQGGLGDDSLTGGAGNDSLFGGDGADVAIFNGAEAGFQFSLVNGLLSVTGEGQDLIGAGVEWLRFDDITRDTASVISGLGGDPGGTGDTGGTGGTGGTDDTDPTPPTITITGSAGRDRIEGTGASELIDGGAQNDRLYGFGGDDQLVGGDGSDRLYGGDGNDRLISGAGTDQFFGGGGQDVFEVSQDARKVIIQDFTQGMDTIDVSDLGVGSLDQLVMTQRNSHVLVEIGNVDILVRNSQLGEFDASDFAFASGGTTPTTPPTGGTGDTGVQTDGTAGRDVMQGTEHDDVINGLGGNDKIHGNAGHDSIYGGDGNDVIFAGGGDDLVVTGTGRDKVELSAGRDTVQISAGNTRTILTDFDIANDVMNLSDLGATSMSDLTMEQKSRNVEVSFGGTEILVKKVLISDLTTSNIAFGALSASAAMAAPVERARLSGTEGDDRIEIGAGRSVAEGGGGADSFVFSDQPSLVRIRDFETDADTLDLTALDLAGMDALTILDRGAHVMVRADELRIKLTDIDVDTLDAGDFLF